MGTTPAPTSRFDLLFGFSALFHSPTFTRPWWLSTSYVPSPVQKGPKSERTNGKDEKTVLISSTCIGLYHVSGMSRRSVCGKRGKGIITAAQNSTRGNQIRRKEESTRTIYRETAKRQPTNSVRKGHGWFRVPHTGTVCFSSIGQ